MTKTEVAETKIMFGIIIKCMEKLPNNIDGYSFCYETYADTKPEIYLYLTNTTTTFNLLIKGHQLLVCDCYLIDLANPKLISILIKIIKYCSKHNLGKPCENCICVTKR